MIEWDDLPIRIQNRILECQEEQGNLRNPKFFRNDSKQGGFIWMDTKEGHDFWSKILNGGKFKEFYDLYPEKDILAKIDEILTKLEKYDNLE